MYDEEESAKLLDTMAEKIVDELENSNMAQGHINEFFEDLYEDDTDESRDFLNRFEGKNLEKVEEAKIHAQEEEILRTKAETPDGEIDSFKQRGIGDCWLLSSINALSYNEIGKEILNDAVSKSDDGYTINFKGLNKEVFISNDELNDAISSNEYSNGDADAVLFEIAFERARDNSNNNNGAQASQDNSPNHENITNGLFTEFMKELTGRDVSVSQCVTNKNLTNNTIVNAVLKPIEAIDDAIFLAAGNDINSALNKIQASDSTVANVDFSQTFDGQARTITDINGTEHIVSGNSNGHAFALKSVDDDTVTIVNPRNSSKDIVLSRDEFSKNVTMIEYIDLLAPEKQYAEQKITAANLA